MLINNCIVEQKKEKGRSEAEKTGSDGYQESTEKTSVLSVQCRSAFYQMGSHDFYRDITLVMQTSCHSLDVRRNFERCIYFLVNELS